MRKYIYFKDEIIGIIDSELDVNIQFSLTFLSRLNLDLEDVKVLESR